MDINKILKIIIIIGILIITISISYYYVIFLPKEKIKDNVITETKSCLEIFEKKKDRYFKGEIGQYGVIFNEKLNTCLVFNIYKNFTTEEYYAMVIDMITDKTLLYYDDTPKGFYFDENGNQVTCDYKYIYFSYLEDGKEIKKYGCEKYELLDEMFAKIKSFGFEVFTADFLRPSK